jgi:hypothetical protein
MRSLVFVLTQLAISILCCSSDAAEPIGLSISWDKNYLTIRGDFPGHEIKTHYLEAYCRAGSTDRDWKETVIPHTAELLEAYTDGKFIKLRDKLADGVIVEHTITAKTDEIDFHLTARNPTDKPSQALWAQPCTRVEQFTGTTKTDARELVPLYARKCFLFINGQLTRLPTFPWAAKARYIPGQVYAAPGVDRNDVNPRPLSDLTPSSGLCGCFSHDEKHILAIAWEPYQEIFQGVVACIHSDFRLGGLAPGETKQIRGKLYIVPADVSALLQRYQQDFPERAHPTR